MCLTTGFFCQLCTTVPHSSFSFTSGMLKTCVDTIKDTLDHLPGNERTHVGFITFDSSVHFYHLKSSLSQPRMLVVSDLDDVSPPIPDDLLVNLKESRAVVDSLLGALFPLFFCCSYWWLAVQPAWCPCIRIRK